VLVFDEVMTGFRIAYGGAQAHFGVTPDVTTMGKVIGGGLPVGAYGMIYLYLHTYVVMHVPYLHLSAANCAWREGHWTNAGVQANVGESGSRRIYARRIIVEFLPYGWCSAASVYVIVNMSYITKTNIYTNIYKYTNIRT